MLTHTSLTDTGEHPESYPNQYRKQQCENYGCWMLPIAGRGLQPRPHVHVGLPECWRWSSGNQYAKIEVDTLF